MAKEEAMVSVTNSVLIYGGTHRMFEEGTGLELEDAL